MDIATYLINLPSSEERRQRMETQLNALGLPYTLFPAVDGRAQWDRLLQTLDAAAFDRNTGRPALPGELGVYHSHLGVWQALVASDAPVALVLEDDTVFHDDFHTALETALSAQDQWDMLKLNKIRAKQPVRCANLGQYMLNAYRGAFTGFGAYLITRELAEKLGPQMLPIRRPIDREADRIHSYQFRHLGLEPFPSHVDDKGESTITGKNFVNVHKRPWFRRLPSYRDRMATLIGKTRYLRRMAQ